MEKQLNDELKRLVFDFPNIIAVKNKEDIIIFIDESKILGIY